jgi:single-stranded DNA-binding protein
MRSWETDQGERRSLVEVEAEDVAPRCRFATATLERTSAKAAAGASKGIDQAVLRRAAASACLSESSNSARPQRGCLIGGWMEAT